MNMNMNMNSSRAVGGRETHPDENAGRGRVPQRVAAIGREQPEFVRRAHLAVELAGRHDAAVGAHAPDHLLRRAHVVHFQVIFQIRVDTCAPLLKARNEM